MAQVANEFEATVSALSRRRRPGTSASAWICAAKSGLVLNVGSALIHSARTPARCWMISPGMLSSLSEGDLSQRIVGNYEGNFALLKTKPI